MDTLEPELSFDGRSHHAQEKEELMFMNLDTGTQRSREYLDTGIITGTGDGVQVRKSSKYRKVSRPQPLPPPARGSASASDADLVVRV